MLETQGWGAWIPRAGDGELWGSRSLSPGKGMGGMARASG